MQDMIYLRPAGLLWGEAGDNAISEGVAGRLAGGFCSWSCGELISRQNGKITRKWFSRADLVAISETAIQNLITRLEAPRKMPANLPLTRPLVMGIVNVTPDSFSDGGQFSDTEAALEHARNLNAAGADILDIGGESTRPGSTAITLDIERARVLPVIDALAKDNHIISIDTRKPEIMREAALAGAAIINDVSALQYAPDSAQAAVESGLPVVLMHSQGSPETMQKDPQYDDVALDVYDQLAQAIKIAVKHGIAHEKLVIDPGIGFGKTFTHNLALLAQMSLFHGLGVPILAGASRKGFIGALTGEKQAEARISGSLGAALAAVQQGVQIVRVHDVRETVQLLLVWHAGQYPTNK